jgi:LAGLIDADG DNA endonuclease family
MVDDSKQNKGLHLSVYAFTPKEIKFLINVLENKFNLKCSIHQHSGIGGKSRIYI